MLANGQHCDEWTIVVDNEWRFTWLFDSKFFESLFKTNKVKSMTERVEIECAYSGLQQSQSVTKGVDD